MSLFTGRDGASRKAGQVSFLASPAAPAALLQLGGVLTTLRGYANAALQFPRPQIYAGMEPTSEGQWFCQNYRQISNISHTLVGLTLLITQM